MGLGDFLILGLIVVWLGATIIYMKKRKKTGGCSGCAGCSRSSCKGCGNRYEKDSDCGR